VVGAEAWVGVEVGVTPIPSVAIFLGCQGGGGQHPMPLNMEQLSRMGDMVTHPMVPTTQPIHLTNGSSH